MATKTRLFTDCARQGGSERGGKAAGSSRVGMACLSTAKLPPNCPGAGSPGPARAPCVFVCPSITHVGYLRVGEALCYNCWFYYYYYYYRLRVLSMY